MEAALLQLLPLRGQIESIGGGLTHIAARAHEAAPRLTVVGLGVGAREGLPTESLTSRREGVRGKTDPGVWWVRVCARRAHLDASEEEGHEEEYEAKGLASER